MALEDGYGLMNMWKNMTTSAPPRIMRAAYASSMERPKNKFLTRRISDLPDKIV